MIFLISVLLLLCILSKGTNIVASQQCDSDPITCYLESLIIYIPDTCFTLNNEELCLTNGYCDEFTLQSFPSNYIPSTSINLTVTNFGLNVYFDYTYGILDGSIDGVVSNAIVNIILDIPKNESNSLPIGAEFTSCNITSISIDLTFDSIIVNTFLEPFIAALIETEIKDLFCSSIANIVSTNLTSLIVDDIDPYLVSIIESEPSTIPLQYIESNNYINWHDSFINTIFLLPEKFKSSLLFDCLTTKYPIISDIVVLPLIDTLIDSATNGTGTVTIDFTDKPVTLPSGLVVNLTISSITLKGLDTFTDFTLLAPDSNNNLTLSASIGLDYLEVTITVIANSSLISGEYTDTYTTSIKLHNVSFTLDLGLAINKDTLDNLYIDQLQYASCVTSTIDYMNITSLILHANISDISIIEATPNPANTDLSDDIVELFDSILELLTHGYNELITELIEGLSQGTIRNGINTMINELFVNNTEIGCPAHISSYDPSSPSLVIWSNSILELIYTMINSIGVDNINDIITCATDNTGGINLVDNKIKVSLNGLNSFSTFAPIIVYDDPTKLYDIGTNITLGLDTNPFTLSITSDRLNISFALVSLTLDLLSDVELDKNKLYDLQVSQFSTYGCLGSTLDAFSIIYAIADVGNADLTVYSEKVAKTTDATTKMNNLLVKLTSPDRIASKNDKISQKVEEADSVCANNGVVPSSNDSINPSNGEVEGWVYFLIGFILILMVIISYYIYNRKIKLSFSCCYIMHRLCSGEQSLSNFWKSFKWTESLAFDKKIPVIIRLVSVVLIIYNMSLFIQSNASNDAVVVQLYINKDTPNEHENSIFYFGLVSTVKDMWNAKVYVLAILIAFFSGFWPYVKLMFMLCSFLLPLSILSVSRREYFLRFLDAYGKWSLIDVFVMVMFTCAFHLHLALAPTLVIDVNVQADFGFFSFLYATMLSLVLGHITLACHRCSVGATSSNEELIVSSDESNSNFENRKISTELAASIRYESLFSHKFLVAKKYVDKTEVWDTYTDDNMIHVSITTIGKFVVICYLGVTFFFIIAGTYIDTFKFEFKGLTGLLLGDDAIVNYSFISVGETLPSTNFGYITTIGSYFAFGLICPLSVLLLTLIMCFVPLSTTFQSRLLVALEIANAWASLDVFCVSIIASLLEIQQFAAFIVGDSCDSINKILEKYLDPVLDGDDKCFDVIAVLNPEVAVIVIAAILVCSTAILVIYLIDVLIHERSISLNNIRNNNYNNHVQNQMHTTPYIQQQVTSFMVTNSESNIIHTFDRPLLPDEKGTKNYNNKIWLHMTRSIFIGLQNIRCIQIEEICN